MENDIIDRINEHLLGMNMKQLHLAEAMVEQIASRRGRDLLEVCPSKGPVNVVDGLCGVQELPVRIEA